MEALAISYLPIWLRAAVAREKESQAMRVKRAQDETEGADRDTPVSVP